MDPIEVRVYMIMNGFTTHLRTFSHISEHDFYQNFNYDYCVRLIEESKLDSSYVPTEVIRSREQRIVRDQDDKPVWSKFVNCLRFVVEKPLEEVVEEDRNVAS